MLFSHDSIVLKARTAELLTQFRKTEKELHIDRLPIDGGGEGVLISIHSLARAYTLSKGYNATYWYIYATNCAQPNPKLQRILKLKEYQEKFLPSVVVANTCVLSVC